MKNIIVGIHGLNNKPPKNLLEKWWKMAIEEGFKRLGLSIPEFDFELVYWADLQYEKPLLPNENSKNDKNIIAEPYIRNGKLEKPKEHKLRKYIIEKIDAALKKIYLRKERPKLEELTEDTMKMIFEDLYDYYNGNCKMATHLKAKDAFRERLENVLIKHKNKNILLIAHSMGNIISYDTLMFRTKKIPIHTFMSLGSPLGYAPVYFEILKELNLKIDMNTKAPTPNNIFYRWYNFADLKDPIALSHTLKDNFYPNIFNVFPTDICVENDYEYKGKKDHHNSFGYLRAYEVTFAIELFLNEDKKFLDRLFKKFKLFFK